MDRLDRAALEALYTRLERPLYNLVYRWVWDAADAQELVQEAFVRLWDMRDRVRPETVEPLAWRIALNLAASRRRTRRLWRWVGLESVAGARAAGGAAERLEENERDAAVRAAVEALPEKLRRVVLLCELGEMSQVQVAEVLGIPVGTVGSRRHAALARLRESLGSFGETTDG